MAQTPKLNGIALTTTVEATWEEIPVNAALDGVNVRNRHRRHRWQAANVMTAADYEMIRGRLGQTVSLTTTDYDSPNGDYRTYYGATLDAVNGDHTGPVYVGVQAEFMVRL